MHFTQECECCPASHLNDGTMIQLDVNTIAPWTCGVVSMKQAQFSVHRTNEWPNRLRHAFWTSGSAQRWRSSGLKGCFNRIEQSGGQEMASKV